MALRRRQRRCWRRRQPGFDRSMDGRFDGRFHGRFDRSMDGRFDRRFDGRFYRSMDGSSDRSMSGRTDGRGRTDRRAHGAERRGRRSIDWIDDRDGPRRGGIPPPSATPVVRRVSWRGRTWHQMRRPVQRAAPRDERMACALPRAAIPRRAMRCARRRAMLRYAAHHCAARLAGAACTARNAGAACLWARVHVRVRACVRASVRACVCPCVHASVRACVRA